MKDHPDSGPAVRIGTGVPLVFMHIPKTGGMSLLMALAEHFGPAISDLYNVSPRNARVAFDAFRDHAKVVYCGHFAFGVHQWFDRPVSYAALVREPIARLTSLYHFCRPILVQSAQRLQRSGRDEKSMWADLKLGDFYFDFPEALQGDFGPEAFFRSPSAELDNGMVRRFSGWGLNPAPCPEAALETAKLNIERHFTVVGVLERYSESLDGMGRAYGFAALNESRVNRGAARPEGESLPAALIERIREMNWMDVALYDWINARFDRSLIRSAPVQMVPGGARTDIESIPLWRSVGQSPFRKAFTENFGKQQALQVVAVSGAAFNRATIQLTLATRRPSPDNPQATLEVHQLSLAPSLAKQLLLALEKTVQRHQEVHGPIEP